MPNPIDLIGKTFNRLYVKELSSPAINTYGRPIKQYLCVCSCGNEVIVRANKISSGHTKSCGCLQKEKASKTHKTHGLRHTNTYGIWAHMKTRCLNPNYPKYHLWGGRGITIYEPWINNFEEFHKYMGDCPAGMSIDRIDNNKGYEPGNVRWATPSQQSNNLRTTRKFTFNGITKTLTDWASTLNITRNVIENRLRRGQSFEEIAQMFSSK